MFFNIIFGCTGSSLLVQAFSSCSEQRLFFIAVHGFLIAGALSLRSTGSQHMDFSSCSMWAQQLWFVNPRAWAQQYRCMGLVAPQHVESSWTRGWPVSPALASRSLSTAPPGKSLNLWDIFKWSIELCGSKESEENKTCCKRPIWTQLE